MLTQLKTCVWLAVRFSVVDRIAFVCVSGRDSAIEEGQTEWTRTKPNKRNYQHHAIRAYAHILLHDIPIDPFGTDGYRSMSQSCA